METDVESVRPSYRVRVPGRDAPIAIAHVRSTLRIV